MNESQSEKIYIFQYNMQPVSCNTLEVLPEDCIWPLISTPPRCTERAAAYGTTLFSAWALDMKNWCNFIEHSIHHQLQRNWANLIIWGPALCFLKEL